MRYLKLIIYLCPFHNTLVQYLAKYDLESEFLMVSKSRQ